jgi:hypothetical protein
MREDVSSQVKLKIWFKQTLFTKTMSNNIDPDPAIAEQQFTLSSSVEFRDVWSEIQKVLSVALTRVL